MTGKEKCRLLREIRYEIAKANGIPYHPLECTFEGACAGTCPRCDAEAKMLDEKLTQMAQEGKSITVAGIATKMFDEAAAKNDATNEYDTIYGGIFEDIREDPIWRKVPAEPAPAAEEPLDERCEPLDDRWLEESIAVLELPAQTYQALMRANITRIIDLVSYTEDDLCDELILKRKEAAEAVGKLARYKKEVYLTSLTQGEDILPRMLVCLLEADCMFPKKRNADDSFGGFDERAGICDRSLANGHRWFRHQNIGGTLRLPPTVRLLPESALLG